MIMTDIPYTAPYLNGDAFNCPNCGAYAKQDWSNHFHNHSEHIQALRTAKCGRCNDFSVWWYGEMVRPTAIPVEKPSNDLPTEVRRDYEEAAQIVQKSPRAAAALLRLAIQKLCASLGGSGDNLNKDIATLVEDGLPVKVQKMLDTVRVVGNHAVHPGQINLDDQPQTAEALFRLVNIIAEKMIAEPKEIDALYGSLPEEDREQIAKRDGAQENGSNN